MMPSCDQIGVPIHFHSSTTSGSASLMSLRILLRVFPRQSPSSAILFEMSSDADWPWLAPDFFMFSSPSIVQSRASSHRPRRGSGDVLCPCLQGHRVVAASGLDGDLLSVDKTQLLEG